MPRNICIFHFSLWMYVLTLNMLWMHLLRFFLLWVVEATQTENRALRMIAVLSLLFSAVQWLCTHQGAKLLHLVIRERVLFSLADPSYKISKSVLIRTPFHPVLFVSIQGIYLKHYLGIFTSAYSSVLWNIYKEEIKIFMCNSFLYLHFRTMI